MAMEYHEVFGFTNKKHRHMLRMFQDVPRYEVEESFLFYLFVFPGSQVDRFGSPSELHRVWVLCRTLLEVTVGSFSSVSIGLKYLPVSPDLRLLDGFSFLPASSWVT